MASSSAPMRFRGFLSFSLPRPSIRPIPLLGGDLAAKELDRIAWVLRREAGLENPDNPVFETMLAQGLNCPLSSGMGRLFDGVAAILGIRETVSYEGQGAVLLEAAATEGEDGRYPVILEGSPLRFDWREMVRCLKREREEGVPLGILAARFMNTLSEMALQMALAASGASGLKDVVLSGGSFQNQYLMRRLPRALAEAGLRPWVHRRVSCNDEGLSLGQVMIGEAARRT